MASIKRIDGRLQNEKGEWVWNGESYEFVLSHSDWLPLTFQSQSDSAKFKKLENIYNAEQIIKNSKNPQEVLAAKQWLSRQGVKHDDMNGSNFIYQISEDSDFLMHHGIKGQKWGVENGPPYPLNPSKDYTKAEKRMNELYTKNRNLAEQDVKGTENYNRRKTNYDLINKNSYDVAFFKSIDETKEEIGKIRSKYKDDKDINTMLNNYEKAINNMVNDIGKIRLTPELKKVAEEYEYYIGISTLGGPLAVAAVGAGTQMALNSRNGNTQGRETVKNAVNTGKDKAKQAINTGKEKTKQAVKDTSKKVWTAIRNF